MCLESAPCLGRSPRRVRRGEEGWGGVQQAVVNRTQTRTREDSESV